MTEFDTIKYRNFLNLKKSYIFGCCGTSRHSDEVLHVLRAAIPVSTEIELHWRQGGIGRPPQLVTLRGCGSESYLMGGKHIQSTPITLYTSETVLRLRG